MPLYAFDARCWIAVRIEANTEQEARELLQSKLDSETLAHRDGTLFEIGIDNAFDSAATSVFEIDGEPVES